MDVPSQGVSYAPQALESRTVEERWQGFALQCLSHENILVLQWTISQGLTMTLHFTFHPGKRLQYITFHIKTILSKTTWELKIRFYALTMKLVKKQSNSKSY